MKREFIISLKISKQTEENKMAKTSEKVAKVGVKKEAGYLYFVDKQGDISRAKMSRGRN
jgi:hypothetical protein